MTDRNLDFKVYLPQLERDPGKFRGGVKRFILQKNEESPAFLMAGSSHSLVTSSLNISNTLRSALVSPLKKDFEETSKKISRVSPLPKLNTKVSISPVKSFNNDPINNRMLNLFSHPAFMQPVYTKHRPKVVNSNPIVGYGNQVSFSPEPRAVYRQASKVLF